MHRKVFVSCLVAIAALGLTATSSSSASVASASATCSTKGDFPPASYVTGIKESGTSCKKARRLIVAYHACRKNNGGANGRCARVDGYKCKETKRQSVPGVQYSTTVHCRKGNNRIASSYTQNI